MTDMSTAITRQIVLDTETTGMNQIGAHYEGHKIIEIGAVEVINRRLTGNNFHVYLKPDRLVDPEAFGVHGIADEFLLDKPTFADVADEFMDYIRGAELVIHNASFDIGFMDYEFSKLNRGIPKTSTFCKVTATAIDQVQVELPNRQQIWLPVESNNVQVGANMSLGIRPEHLLPSHIANVTLEGVVNVVEQLGHETQIHIQIPAIRQNLVYRQNDVVLVEEGATFAIGLPPERCHLFREDGTACRRQHKEPGV